MAHAYSTLRIEAADPQILVLTLDRPQAANAINTAMAQELMAFFTGFAQEPGDVRCLVVTGAGQRAFCAGGDLKERDGMTDETWRAQHLFIEQAIRAMLDCPIPTIGAVNGAAYGGGCELALNLDFAYASDTATFALTETRLGIIPGAGGTQNLARAVGVRRARELIFSATPFSAADALAWGAINRVCASAELMPLVLDTARRIASNAPLAVRQAKKAIQAGSDVDLRSGLLLEIDAYNVLVSTADRREGAAAFNQKRAPQFKGI